MTDTECPGDDLSAALAAMFSRKEWGNYTAFSIAVTDTDENGDYELVILGADGDPFWLSGDNFPARCNVNDPEGERDAVLGMVVSAFEQFQAERRTGLLRPGDKLLGTEL